MNDKLLTDDLDVPRGICDILFIIDYVLAYEARVKRFKKVEVVIERKPNEVNIGFKCYDEIGRLYWPVIGFSTDQSEGQDVSVVELPSALAIVDQWDTMEPIPND